MVALRIKRKLAAVSRETPENTMNNKSQNTPNPGTAGKYISQVSEEIERRVTRKLSKEFSRTESCILGALSKHDEFFLSPQVRSYSGNIREQRLSKPGTDWGSLPRHSLSQSGVLYLSL